MMTRYFRHSKEDNGYTGTSKDTSQKPGSKAHQSKKHNKTKWKQRGKSDIRI